MFGTWTMVTQRHSEHCLHPNDKLLREKMMWFLIGFAGGGAWVVFGYLYTTGHTFAVSFWMSSTLLVYTIRYAPASHDYQAEHLHLAFDLDLSCWRRNLRAWKRIFWPIILTLKIEHFEEGRGVYFGLVFYFESGDSHREGANKNIIEDFELRIALHWMQFA